MSHTPPTGAKRGTYGIGIYQPAKEVNVGTLIRSAFVYGADFVFFIGGSADIKKNDTTKAYRHMPILKFPDYYTARDTLWQYAFVGVDNGVEASVPVEGYQHPQQAVYLLGNEAQELPADVLADVDATIHIATEKAVSLNVAVAGSTILYDRHLKDSFWATPQRLLGGSTIKPEDVEKMVKAGAGSLIMLGRGDDVEHVTDVGLLNERLAESLRPIKWQEKPVLASEGTIFPKPGAPIITI